MPRPKGKTASKGQKGNDELRLNVRTLLAKAAVLTGRQVDEPSAIATMESTSSAFESVGAVDPPYDPESLLNYIELTPHLAPSIASYQTNIEGYGFLPILTEAWMEDLESDDAREAIRNALQIERWAEEEEAALLDAQRQTKADDDYPGGEPQGDEGTEPSTPDEEGPIGEEDEEDEGSGDITDEEVDAVIKNLTMELRREKYLFDSFFKTCCSAMSFTKLRWLTRYDFEAHGWGCWEMLVDGLGRLKRLNYIPGYTIRPLIDEGSLVEVTEPDPITPLSEGREVVVFRRFRRYVQIVKDKKVYFRSPGDPRVISRTTGTVYESLDQMRAPTDKEGEGPDAQIANELIYFSQHDPRTPCPPPRWIGNLLSVLGVREADEANYFYLSSSAIPPGILFVAGGKLGQGMKDRLEQRLTKEFAGSNNRHKILVVEALPMKMKGEERTMLPSMEYSSLRDSHQQDATFTAYDQRSSDRIGASFRLPPMLRGYTPKDLNRATAIAALDFAEAQVFEPERTDFDWVINQYILPRIGVKLYSFKSNSPPTRSPEEIAELIRVAAPHGGILPYEIRTLLGDALNKALAKIDEDWAYMPMPMTLAGMGGNESALNPQGDEEAPSIAEMSSNLARLQDRVEQILTEHIRAAGLEVDLKTSWMDVDPDENADG